jgi:hypothetical protein
MVRRPNAADARHGIKAGRSKVSPIPAAPQSRIDRLVALIDHCSAARQTADELGETFLSYLLAMAIQEGRSAMRQSSDAQRT